IPLRSGFNDITFVAPWSLYESSDSWVRNAREENDWGNNSFQLFVQIADNADLDAVNAKIKSVKYDHASEGDRELDPEIFLHPLKDWRLYSNWENGVLTGLVVRSNTSGFLASSAHLCYCLPASTS